MLILVIALQYYLLLCLSVSFDLKRLPRSMNQASLYPRYYQVEPLQSRLKMTPSNILITVACIIVRRLLISVHKWQFPGMADTHKYWSQHDAYLVYLPIFHNFFIMEKPKFTEIFNIC